MDHRRVYDFFSRPLPPISALQGPATSAGQGAAHIKGKPQVLKVLQEVLTDELGAVHGLFLIPGCATTGVARSRRH